MNSILFPQSRISPGGRIQVEFCVEEEVEVGPWLRTRRVANPRVIDAHTGRVLLDLWDSDWDADARWLDYATVRLDLFIWNLRQSFVVLINAEYLSYCLLERDEVWRPLDDQLHGQTGSKLGGGPCPVREALEQALDDRLHRPAGCGPTNAAPLPPLNAAPAPAPISAPAPAPARANPREPLRTAAIQAACG